MPLRPRTAEATGCAASSQAATPGDLPPESAYLIRRGETQLYGCAVCGGGRAMDTIALIRRVYPALDFSRDADALPRDRSGPLPAAG
jgi:hypothetical protein